MNPGANFKTSLVAPLVILVALVKIQIGQGSSNLGMSRFLAIRFSLVIET